MRTANTLSTAACGRVHESVSCEPDPSTALANVLRFSSRVSVGRANRLMWLGVLMAWVGSCVPMDAETVPQVAKPIFSVAAGTYQTVRSVKISDKTAGAAIYYTLDGTVPTSKSKKYSGALPIEKTTVLKAVAEEKGFAESAIATAIYTILKPQTITFSQPKSPIVYGSKSIDLIAKASSGLVVSFKIISGPGKVSGHDLTVTGAGLVKVAATQAGNKAFAAAPEVTRSITVDKATQTITFNAPKSPITYGVGQSTLSATSTSKLPVTFKILSGPGKVIGNTLSIIGAGTVTVAAEQAGNLNFKPATQVSRSVRVGKATLTITAKNATRGYCEPNPAFAYTEKGLVNGDTLTVKYSTPATPPSPMATYPIAAAVSGSKLANYITTVNDGVLTVNAGTPGETVLYRFAGGTADTELPQGKLLMDPATCNLYGTSLYGGAHKNGVVFEIYISGSVWSEKLLYSFGASSTDGVGPVGGLVMDSNGNLFGTTVNGGTFGAANGGFGTVFELSPSGSTWTENVIYNFGSGTFNPLDDGRFPYDYEGLIMDPSGNLYGTTAAGGLKGEGIAFELSPTGSTGSPWTESVLYNFLEFTTDGYEVRDGLIKDSQGNLYGTARSGGTDGNGIVFELSPGSPWTETVLYNFAGGTGDGGFPRGSLVLDQVGNLYGTTNLRGATNSGTVFELSPGTPWTEKVLYSFGDTGVDGENPFAGLVMDSSGDLYGTTESGNSKSVWGTVFELAPPTSSSSLWTENTLHSFGNIVDDGDGAYPNIGDLIIDSVGNLYGTTNEGGIGYGTVYKVVP